MRPATIMLLSTGLAGAMLAAAPARGGDWSNAVDICQGSLPSFEGALRKRPLAIANEGTSTAFVSCSIRTSFGDDVTGIVVVMINRGASNQTFSCTLVEGIALPYLGNPPVYQPESTTIEAGNNGGFNWNYNADNDGDFYEIPNLNCSLPPGGEINAIQVNTLGPE